MNKALLEQTAKALVVKSKGILAADESFNSIEKRFESIQIPSTESNRQKYRDLLLTTPDINKYLSGVILFDETIRQKGLNGQLFTQTLKTVGIMPGIKVDTGAKPLSEFSGEQITYGLDGLSERFTEYKLMGATFSKWRGVITIGEGIPTQACIDANTHALARYASLAQEADIVPIVEPEVVMEGSHSLVECQKATEASLLSLFEQLAKYRVHLPGIILKPNMVNSGTKASIQSSPQECAQATVETLLKVVPKEVPGIVFLSGGLTPDQATDRLHLINTLAQDAPWELSYSFGRALQQEALITWAGNDENVSKAQEIYLKRLSVTSKARDGKLDQ